MSGRANEYQKMSNEVVTISSAGGATSQRYYMGEGYKLDFIVGGGTAAASTALAPTITVRQAVDEAAATSTTIASATGTLYAPATANQVQRAHSALLSMSTASTLTETVVINAGGSTYTLTYVGQSTLVSTVATALAFGSSVGSSNAGGLEAAMNSFSSVVNNSTLSAWLTASTPSTLAVRLTINDTALNTSGVNILTTGANLTPSYEKYVSRIAVLSEDLNTTSAYCYLTISSAATTVQCSIGVIKSGLRYAPSQVSGQTIKST
jgi:hypothetical protein